MTWPEQKDVDRNERSLSALFEQMGRNPAEFIRHVAWSMALSSAMIRERGRTIIEMVCDARPRKLCAVDCGKIGG